MRCGCSSESHSPLAVQSEGEREAATIKSRLPPCIWEPKAVSRWLCSAFQGWQMQGFTVIIIVILVIILIVLATVIAIVILFLIKGKCRPWFQRQPDLALPPCRPLAHMRLTQAYCLYGPLTLRRAVPYCQAEHNKLHDSHSSPSKDTSCFWAGAYCSFTCASSHFVS